MNVIDFGATPNDATDDTQSIQKAIDSAAESKSVVKIPDGKFLINTDPKTGTLKLRDHSNLQLSSKTVLKAIPNDLDNYRVISIDDIEHVQVSGGKLQGDRYEHEDTTGQWGHGIFISGSSSNIEVSDVKAADFWGDGFYIGGDEPLGSYPKNITITNSIGENNRRQGLSITAGKDIVIKDNLFAKTNGTAPEAGIDLERNPPYNLPLENVTLTNNDLIDNNGYGLAIVYASHNIAEQNKITGNLKGGVYIGGKIPEAKAEYNKIHGNVIESNGGNFSDANYGSGVLVNYAQFNTISKNRIAKNEANGIYLLNNIGGSTIKKNIIEQNTDIGLKVWGGTEEQPEITIRDNDVVKNGGHGFSLSMVENIKVLDNRITENEEMGIFLANTTSPILESNVLTKNKINEIIQQNGH